MMKQSQTAQFMSIMALLVLWFSHGCASSGGQDEFADNINENFGDNLEFENNLGNDQFANDEFGNDQFANDEFTNNQFADDGFGNNNLGNFENDGEFVNSAENDFNQFAFNNPGNNQFEINEQINDDQAALFGNNQQFNNNQAALFNNNEQSENQGLAVNNAEDNEFNNISDNFIDEVNGNAVDSGLVESEPIGLPPAKVDPDATVQYILPGGSDLFQTENGAISGRLQQGDHPLVFGDGEWLRTSDGYYIPFRRLSNTPIGRRKERASWSP